jgi:hypothetical protein
VAAGVADAFAEEGFNPPSTFSVAIADGAGWMV